MSKEFERQAAEIVGKARKFSKLSQTEVGKLVGRTQTVVSKYERGETPVPGEIVIQCMALLGLLENAPPSADDVAELVRATLKDQGKTELRRALADLVKSIRSTS
jgi:transcriptional regulator with XRE-family HTH domain